jgi:hypothetical protein
LKANVFSLRTQNGLKMIEAMAVPNVITFHSHFEDTRPTGFMPLRVISVKINLETQLANLDKRSACCTHSVINRITHIQRNWDNSVGTSTSYRQNDEGSIATNSRRIFSSPQHPNLL